jgi:hypothetical protein
MRRKVSSRSAFIVGVASLMGLASSIAGAAPASAESVGPQISTVLSGLNAPRGVAFDREGDLYAAQSGVVGVGASGLNRTGKVSKYRPGSKVPSWTTTFESVYLTADPSQPPDVLGPEGITVGGNGCRTDSEQHSAPIGDGKGDDGRGCTVMVIMSESHDGVASVTKGAVSTKDAGHLYRLNPATGRAKNKSDVGDQNYAFTKANKNLFLSDFPDANPYGVLATQGDEGRARTFVADAAANMISEVMPGGKLRNIAYIPNESAPPFRDATPTCIAQGPDGMLYVATLHFVANLFVHGPGQSDVWRVNPNVNFPAAPHLWASGLTTPTACTFDRNGNFWATEMFQPHAGGAPGDVVRIPFKDPTKLTRIGGGKLPLPGGIAQAPNGDMYVSINSSNPQLGSGAIVRIADGTEPTDQSTSGR